MSLVYIFSKFTEEALTLELFLMSLLCFCLFGYFLFKRRRYGVAKEQISDQVVRAFLTELLSVSESFRIQLFGEQFQPANLRGMAGQISESLGHGTNAGSPNPQLQQQVSSLQKELGAAAENQVQLNKQVMSMRSEKEGVEAKLKEALAKADAAVSAASAGGGANPAQTGELDELKKKAANLEARLAEYEVIEDDLANLKKFQQENAALRAELEMLKGGKGAASVSAASASVAAAPPEMAPVETTPPLSERTNVTSEDFDALAREVQESINEEVQSPEPALEAAPSGGSAMDPQAITAAQTVAETSDTAPAPSAAAAPEASNDNDLLSEFEKMLSS